MRVARDLAEALDRIDGGSYKAYRDIEGAWAFLDFELHVDRAQSDPFAPPSRIRVRIPREAYPLSAETSSHRVRRIASESFLAREFRDAIRSVGTERVGTGKGGLVEIDAGGQEVLERTAVRISDKFIEARIEVGLPAAGRRVLGSAASALLLESLPRIVDRAWTTPSDSDIQRLNAFIQSIENQEHVRAQLSTLGLMAFIGDGAILPRASGDLDGPMPQDEALPFDSPDAFRVEIEVPYADATARPGSGTNDRTWSGMGIPKGVVLLVGGGYHGKSTLLRAVERGIAPHVPGDGRERVVSDPGLVKIRAEDGRSVRGVDIAAFIDRLPSAQGSPPSPQAESPARGGRHPHFFSSADASGSTSQAASLIEALEVGASGLLLDEDTSATNLMIRDERMQALIHSRDEPITPFVARVRALFEERGVSSLIVMGASGDYFEKADAVIALANYQPRDVTAEAHAIAHATAREATESRGGFSECYARIPVAGSFDARRGRKEHAVSTRGRHEITFGRTEIDLRAVEQIFDASQTRAIAAAIRIAADRFMSEGVTLAEVLDQVEALLDQEGLEILDPFQREGQHPGAFARPRRFEIAAAINRMRSLKIASERST